MKEPGMITLKRFEEESKMLVLHPEHIFHNVSFPRKIQLKSHNNALELPVLPNQNSSLKLGKKIPTDRKIINAAFGTSAQCVIALSIFNWISINPWSYAAVSANETLQNVSILNMTANVLYSVIANNIQHPPGVVQAAAMYATEVIAAPEYIGIHWRYDKKDWMKLCKNPAAWTEFICENLKTIKPHHVAKAVAEAVFDDLKAFNRTFASLPVYIATPPGEQDFANEVYDEFEKLNISYFRPSKSLEAFLTDRYSACWQENGWTNIANLLSLSEMEIMKNSFWYFYSSGSTWSGYVRRLRFVSDPNGKRKQKFEKAIVKLVVNYIKKVD